MRPEIRQQTTGRWPYILTGLGVDAGYLRNRHMPCPGCGGRDRWRFDDKEGRGTFSCGGGGDPVSGDGFALLSHVYGWDFKTAADRVRKVLGIEPGQPNPILPKHDPLPSPQRSITQPYANDLWKAANRDDGHVASHPYCVRKGINCAFGAARGHASGRLVARGADCLLIPNRDWEGRLVGVEAINPEGVKQTFGTKGLLVLGCPEDSSLIHVCEGWATAWALSQLFPERFGCVVAFGKSRLEQYAADAQTRFQVNIALHQEANNRDVWDLWIAGEGEYYAQRTRRTAGV